MEDEGEKLHWAERAQKGVKDSLAYIKENGAELFNQALTVTGVVAVTATTATVFGIEMADGNGAKAFVAVAIVGYKIYSAIKKMREKDKREAEVNDSASTDVFETISIDDYRNLQKNMDMILGSHDVLVNALKDSEGANRNLQQANDELVQANHQLRTSLGKFYRLETQSAQDMGLLERAEFQYDESKSIFGNVDLGTGKETVRSMAELYEDETEDGPAMR